MHTQKKIELRKGQVHAHPMHRLLALAVGRSTMHALNALHACHVTHGVHAATNTAQSTAAAVGVRCTRHRRVHTRLTHSTAKSFTPAQHSKELHTTSGARQVQRTLRGRVTAAACTRTQCALTPAATTCSQAKRSTPACRKAHQPAEQHTCRIQLDKPAMGLTCAAQLAA